MPATCVFLSSSPGVRPEQTDAIQALARAIAAAGHDLVYGGASVGLMGVLADAALAAGGTVIGVIPRALVDREVAHGGLTELHVVGSLHERKALMAELSDGFVALPGGFGTLDELLEQLTWSQLGLHVKPLVFYDIGGFWRALEPFLDLAVSEGVLRAENRSLIQIVDDPVRAVAMVTPAR